MDKYEIELDGYDTTDGKPVLTVGLCFDDCDDWDYYLTSYSVTDDIKLTENEVCELVDKYLKDRFKPDLS